MLRDFYIFSSTSLGTHWEVCDTGNGAQDKKWHLTVLNVSTHIVLQGSTAVFEVISYICAAQKVIIPVFNIYDIGWDYIHNLKMLSIWKLISWTSIDMTCNMCAFDVCSCVCVCQAEHLTPHLCCSVLPWPPLLCIFPALCCPVSHWAPGFM